MKMTTPFKAADEFEKELKEFSKKHRNGGTGTCFMGNRSRILINN